jgi:hypothetical protein
MNAFVSLSWIATLHIVWSCFLNTADNVLIFFKALFTVYWTTRHCSLWLIRLLWWCVISEPVNEYSISGCNDLQAIQASCRVTGLSSAQTVPPTIVRNPQKSACFLPPLLQLSDVNRSDWQVLYGPAISLSTGSRSHHPVSSMIDDLAAWSTYRWLWFCTQQIQS